MTTPLTHTNNFHTLRWIRPRVKTNENKARKTKSVILLSLPENLNDINHTGAARNKHVQFWKEGKERKLHSIYDNIEHTSEQRLINSQNFDPRPVSYRL